MKLAITILRQQRQSLHRSVQEKTNHAESYCTDANRYRDQVVLLVKKAEYSEKQASEACEIRNKFQAQLNELDAAIAKLES